MTENPTQSGLSKIQNLPSSHISKPSWKGVGIDTAQMKSRHFSLTLLLMAQLTPFLDSSLVVSRWLPLVLPGPIQQKWAFVPAFPAKVLSFTLDRLRSCAYPRANHSGKRTVLCWWIYLPYHHSSVGGGVVKFEDGTQGSKPQMSIRIYSVTQAIH